MPDNKTWKIVKDFYGDSFGFPEGLVELASNNDVLLMSVSGTSNESISKFFHLSAGSVESILNSYLNFGGWESDLDFNPYAVYCELVNHGYYSLDAFIKEVKQTQDVEVDMTLLTTAYRICSLYYRLEDKLRKEWY